MPRPIQARRARAVQCPTVAAHRGKGEGLPQPPGLSPVVSVVREFVAEFGRARLLAEFIGAGIVGAAFAMVWWLA